MGPQTPVGEPETANWQSSPFAQSALLKQVEAVPLVGAGPVGSITDAVDAVDLGGAEVAAEVFTGAGVEVGTTGAMVVVVVGGDVCGTVVVVVTAAVADVGLGVTEVVVSPGALGSDPGAGDPGAAGRCPGSMTGPWATMPVGAVTRRVIAHSTKREVALDNFMVERYSGAGMWKVCRSETNRVVQERTGDKNIEGRRERREIRVR